MNNAKIIEGLKEVVKGANILIEELSGGATANTDEKTESKKVTKSVETPKKETSEKTENTEVYSREELDKKKYNDLKKLGASLGVSCKGTRDEITDRILAVAGDISEDTESKADEKKSDDKVVKFEEKKKLGKKKADATEETKEPEIEEEFMTQAREVAEATDVKDIIEALAEVGVKAKGKKSDVIPVLAKALQEGLISLDDEEEEEDDESETVSGEVEEDITADSYFADYDVDGVNDPDSDTMTEDRAKAIVAKMQEIIDSVSDESLTEEDIMSFIEDNASEAEKELLGDDYTEEQLVSLYMELVKKTIDDDGEEHEPSDPYVLAEKNFCCGHPLKYMKKQKKFVCSICGDEYEDE